MSASDSASTRIALATQGFAAAAAAVADGVGVAVSDAVGVGVELGVGVGVAVEVGVELTDAVGFGLGLRVRSLRETPPGLSDEKPRDPCPDGEDRQQHDEPPAAVHRGGRSALARRGSGHGSRLSALPGCAHPQRTVRAA